MEDGMKDIEDAKRKGVVYASSAMPSVGQMRKRKHG